ncbi:hypothetical protein JCM3775_004374 [Rhodotorula graminis]
MATYADIEMLTTPPNLVNQLIGPLATGYLLEVVLYGSFGTVFLSYCISGDFARLPGRANRITLAVLFGLVTVTTVLTADALWKLAVAQTRTIDEIIAGPTESCLLTLFGGLTGSLTQVALARRAGAFIDSLKIRWAFYTFIAALVGASLFGSIAATVIGFIWAVEEPDFINTLNWSTSIAIWLWSSAVADCAICGTLGWALRRRVAGFNSRTDGLLKCLAWLSVRSASYTAIVAVGGAIAGSLYRDTVIEWSNLSVAFWAPMPPLYGFAFFSTTSASRRAVQDAFAPTSTRPDDGAVTFPSPPSLVPPEKRPRSSTGATPPPRRLSVPAPARLASVLERVRAACTGSGSSPCGRSAAPYEVDLERARLGGARARGGGQRSSFGLRSGGGGGGGSTTTSKAGVRDERAWRTSTHTHTEPRELRIQVDQLVETRVEWSDDVEPPMTPPY